MKWRTQGSWCISKMPSAKEHGNFLVHTVDTGVIVFLVGHFHELKSLQSSLLVWGGGGHWGRVIDIYYSIYAICDHIGEQYSSKGLPIFHAFTGCDINSSFYGKGKSHDEPRGIAFLV